MLYSKIPIMFLFCSQNYLPASERIAAEDNDGNVESLIRIYVIIKLINESCPL